MSVPQYKSIYTMPGFAGYQEKDGQEFPVTVACVERPLAIGNPCGARTVGLAGSARAGCAIALPAAQGPAVRPAPWLWRDKRFA